MQVPDCALSLRKMVPQMGKMGIHQGEDDRISLSSENQVWMGQYGATIRTSFSDFAQCFCNDAHWGK